MDRSEQLVADAIAAMNAALGDVFHDDPAAAVRAHGAMVRVLRDAIDSALRSTAWRPMSEAPVVDLVDVRPNQVLVYSPSFGVQMGQAFRFPSGEPHGSGNNFHGDWNVTHWQPLPPPPTGEVGG